VSSAAREKATVAAGLSRRMITGMLVSRTARATTRSASSPGLGAGGTDWKTRWVRCSPGPRSPLLGLRSMTRTVWVPPGGSTTRRGEKRTAPEAGRSSRVGVSMSTIWPLSSMRLSRTMIR